MKVHIEQNFIANSVKIWAYSRTPGYRRIWRPGEWPGGNWQEIGGGENEPMPAPSLEIDVDVLEALVAEAGNYLPPTAATDRHLKDAVEVRDRLLALIEQNFVGPKTDE